MCAYTPVRTNSAGLTQQRLLARFPNLRTTTGCILSWLRAQGHVGTPAGYRPRVLGIHSSTLVWITPRWSITLLPPHVRLPVLLTVWWRDCAEDSEWVSKHGIAMDLARSSTMHHRRRWRLGVVGTYGDGHFQTCNWSREERRNNKRTQKLESASYGPTAIRGMHWLGLHNNRCGDPSTWAEPTKSIVGARPPPQARWIIPPRCWNAIEGAMKADGNAWFMVFFF